MKRIRNSSSSASETELAPHQELNNKKRNSFKPERKQFRFDTKGPIMTEEEAIPEESLGSDFGFKELGMMLKSFKEQTGLQFDRLSTTVMEMWLQLQEQIKCVHDDVADVKTSINGTWMEIEVLKKEVSEKTVVIDQLDKTVKSLQASLEAEKRRRLLLDSYSRRENLRLVGMEENEDEDTEGLVREILNEMGVLRESIEFHTVRCVGQKRVSTKSESSANSNGPSQSYNRQIIMRFVNR